MSDWIETRRVRPDLPKGTLVYIRDAEGWESNFSHPIEVFDVNRFWRWDGVSKAPIVAYRLAESAPVRQINEGQETPREREPGSVRPAPTTPPVPSPDYSAITARMCGRPTRKFGAREE